MRRPGVVVGTAFVTVLALLVALGLILFSVNPGVNRNEGKIKRTQAEIEKAVMSQHAIICAQVQNTANAYRFRSLTPSGKVEPIRHFLTRMQAQQQTLRLAQGSECKSAPGFLPVGIQVRRALDQIKRILGHFAPKLKEPVRNQPSASTPERKHRSSSQGLSRLFEAGIDESGVSPAALAPGLAPSAPAMPQTRHQHKAPPSQTPEALPVAPEQEASPPSAGGTQAVQPFGRRGLTLPVAEVKVETKGLP